MQEEVSAQCGEILYLRFDWRVMGRHFPSLLVKAARLMERGMRQLVLVILALLGSGVASPGAAQTPDVLFRGTVRPVLAHGTGAWCAAELGPTLFQRGSTQRALISFPAVHYALTAGSPTYYTLSGHVRMSYSTATTGILRFDYPKDYPDDVTRPEFTQYSETYNAATRGLVVRFRLKFPNCNLIVNNTYWD